MHAAGGAVGSALLELSSLENLIIFGTATAEKHESLQRFGAALIDYRQENFVEKKDNLNPAEYFKMSEDGLQELFHSR